MKEIKLENKFAVVTGASTGIGRAIALELAKEGASIALVARTEECLEKTKELIEKEDGKAKIFVADLSELNSINNLISEIEEETNNIDILANVAGVWHGEDEVYADKKLESFSQEVIIDTYRVGTIAPTLLVHAFVSSMPRGGKIINVSGTFSDGAEGWLPYYVSKRAIEDLTIGLAEELSREGIQVNCISPSDVATEAYKKYFSEYVEDAITPEKIAKYAVYLCSKEADNITGKVFVVEKGEKPYEAFHS